MSPYLSSKAPCAPNSFASSGVTSCISIERVSFIFSLTKSSIAFFSSSVNFLSKLKSNLNLSGVMLEPLWDIFLSFRITRRAWFNR